MRETGKYQLLGDLSYFIPYPLPPSNPSLQLNTEIISLYGEASFALGQLNEMGSRLPDPNRFIKAYVIKEALLSSAIEGIHTTLIDVFTYPLGESKPNKDTQLVLNYTKALDTALTMLKSEGFPIVTRVILQAHKALMSAGEGEKAAPGNYRKQSVRVGDHVPPPSIEIPNLMNALERYINESSEIPLLIKAGLVHVQFETIHPFLDGNGRIGRLLIVLMLIDSGLLNLPILYPSHYFKKHHYEYYQRLDRVRTHGDFEGWIIYYLKALRDNALDAYNRAKEIEALESSLTDLIQKDPHFAKMRETASRILNFLFMQPITTIADISQKSGKAYNTVNNVLKQFISLGVISENIIHKRNKVYRFELYLTLLEKEYT
ncbi:MAG: Fic family protein [Candidatus Paracaedibacteraceae bacterium]|nr:Fic family protein [Candidatus Paracaedibacteraceae bacterium]